MALSVRERQLVKRLAWVVAISAAWGAAYGATVRSATALAGVPTGTTIGASCAGFDLFYVGRRRGERSRQLPYLVNLGLRTGFYFMVIVGSIWIWTVVLFSRSTRWGLSDTAFRVTVGVSFAVALAFNFVLATQRLVGPGVMASYVSGRYYRPLEEERVFMFVDLAGSTEIAERIGHLGFHSLLNRFCYDISEPIAANRGEIYKYFGDEVIVTWPIARGLDDANCLRCYFDVSDALSAAREDYLREFGVASALRAGLHAGTVVTGELGDAKQEIAFLGDTVNTASRIEQLCRERGHSMIVSGPLLSRLELPPEFRAESIGRTQLRGKEDSIELFTLAHLVRTVA